MAKINFGGVEENVVTREEFPLKKALETLKDETIAVIGYGVQGPGQSLNLPVAGDALPEGHGAARRGPLGRKGDPDGQTGSLSI